MGVLTRRLPTLAKYGRNTTTWYVASSTDSHAFAVLTATPRAEGEQGPPDVRRLEGHVAITPAE